MIPKDHGFGTSFKGVGQYLLHDKGHANTNERVTWTHTEGFGTSDAETAFRIMAAVAMDADRLKRQAHEAEQAQLPEDERKPFRNGGRKSNQHVWHFSLAWHPDEAEGLTKEHMIEAAKDALAQLGKKGHTADQHQAVFVCHDDEPQPHVHVVVNRVNPNTGKMLSKYNDWKKFSRWAQKYEEERGKVYCHQRRANNMTRDMGGHVYGKGDLPHHLATAKSVKRDPSNDNEDRLAKVEAEQRAKTAELAQKGRDQAKRHLDELAERRELFLAQKRQARAEAVKAVRAAKAKVFAAYQPHQTALLEVHEMRIAEFESRERDLFGKARNMIEAVKATWSVQRAEDRPVKLSDYYKPFSGEGARLEAFKEQMRQEQRKLEIERQKAHGDAVGPIVQRRQQKVADARTAYADERDAIKARHAQEDDELKALWLTRRVQQDRAIEAAKLASYAKDKRARETFAEAATEPPEMQGDDTGDNSAGDQRSHSPAPSRGDMPEYIRKAKAALKARREFREKRGQPKDDPGHEH
ncbi:MAG: relaxase/mobilization nuclease domain-containing protein [Pseudomonadota bacterium]